MVKKKNYSKAIKKYFPRIHWRMKYLLCALIALVVLDGLISHFLVAHGLAREGNPFLQGLVGERNFLIIKLVGALLCAFILWDIYKARPKMALISSLCFVVLYSGIVSWNLFVFFVA